MVIVLILVIIAGLVILILNPRQPTPIIITPGLERAEHRFEIAGAIRYPGVYRYYGTIRIEDAVEMAGGLAEDADAARANLAKWIDDGETLIIPTLSPIQPTLTPVSAERLKINLNTAGKSELILLPGIGEKKADDIIHLREQIGGFQKKEDILQITGIGKKLLESIYDMIFVE